MIYRYECGEHGEFEAVSTIEGRHDMRCPKCGRKAKKLIVPLAGILPDITPEYYWGLKKFIRSRRELNEEVKRRGLYCYGNDYKAADAPDPKETKEMQEENRAARAACRRD
jgi:hypothetical protein